MYERIYYRSRRRKAVFMLVVFAGAFFLTLCGNLFAAKVYAGSTGTVTGDGVRVRREPDTSTLDNVLTKLDSGEQVNILDTWYASDNYKWYKVSFEKDGTAYEGYMAAEFVTVNPDYEYKEDADFEEWLEKQGFPDSYRDGLRQLHARYPKWIFVADHLNYDWEEAVYQETRYGRSLIHSGAISSWKSTDDTAYNWPEDRWYGMDGGAWNIASREIVAYAMDPRNYLDTTRIFAFDLLSYNGAVQTEAGVASIIANSFMKATGTIGDGTLLSDSEGEYTYSRALMKAGVYANVSPYHLATRIIQEVSIGTDGASNSITGTVSGYEGLYNYYNQGAYAANGRGPIENGLIYARNKGWTDRLTAMLEGAKILGSQYIAIGQDTLYHEKFDFVGQPYTHQYMTFVLAPYQESVTSAKAYSEEIRRDTALVFKIPVFQNMPQTPCPKPVKDGSPNNILSYLEIEGVSMTPEFDYTIQEYNAIVGNHVKSVNIKALANKATASFEGNGVVALKEGYNTVEIVVTAQNGDKRTYTVTLYREPGKEDEPKSFETTLSRDPEKGFVSGISFGTTAQQVLATCTFKGGLYGTVTDKNGREKAATDIVGTGDRLIVRDKDDNEYASYEIILYGDVDGNGVLNTYDFIYVRMHIMQYSQLSGCYLEAADADRRRDGISTYDFIYIRMQIMGYGEINQH